MAAEQGTLKNKRTSMPQFLKEVRQEGRKVTWTTRKETIVTTIMVFIMVAIMATFFFVVDLALGALVRAVLGLGQ
mgnify:CR=1 FL=1